MTETNSTQSRSCANCQKMEPEDTDGTPLQRCSRCKSIFYCSQYCQKADWKYHKGDCSKRATGSGTSSCSSAFKSTKPLMESLLGLNTTTWLHSRPEAEVYKLLIDSYRMRVEDDYNFRGDVSDDSIYGQGDPTVGFRRYLVKAEKTSVLPSWWSKEKRDACIAKGNARDHWSSLHFAVEKSDIQEHYENPAAPMQLRMLAEEIIGFNVMAH